MANIYVRVGPDDEWHWLGIVDNGIEIKREKEGRLMVASASYHIELKL